MGSAPEYVFSRDHLDNNRINLQHYYWIDAFGYHIHPSVPTSESHLRIADVGTGTGIWLSAIARLLPKTTQLDGLDISFDAAPPQEWMPANIKFYKWNVFEDPPEELVGVYDIVNIRHFVFVLRDEQAPVVLDRLLRLLKPGGYLQWGDIDMASGHAEKTKPENKADAMMQLMKSTQGADARFTPQWVATLPDLFANAGMDKIVSDVQEMAPDISYRQQECGLMAPEIYARKAQNKELLDKLSQIMPQVLNEAANGVRWASTRCTVVGQKPLL